LLLAPLSQNSNEGNRQILLLCIYLLTISNHHKMYFQICGMTGREYTYEMAYGMSRKFGSALKRLGAKKGDCLCMVVPNIPEFPIAFFGAAGVGVTLTTMNPTYRPGD
jgi:acyl-coenzyme A synthetase/AMP-(fatty) acid ligase